MSLHLLDLDVTDLRYNSKVNKEYNLSIAIYSSLLVSYNYMDLWIFQLFLTAF